MSRRSSRHKLRMVLQGYTETVNEHRQRIKTPVDLASIWCRVEFAYKGEEMMGGSRQSETPQLASLSQVWIYTRRRTDVEFSPRYRLKYGSRIFEIIAVYDANHYRRELKLLCREIQS